MEAPPPSRFSIRIDNFVDDDTGTTFYRTSCDLLLDDRGSMIRRFSAARRYSEFKAMHAELAPQLEKLPSKFLVPKRLRHSHSAKLQRAAALQDYLTAVVSAVGDQAVPAALAKFLSLDAEASLDQSDLNASLKRKKDISNSIVADAVGAAVVRRVPLARGRARAHGRVRRAALCRSVVPCVPCVAARWLAILTYRTTYMN